MTALCNIAAAVLGGIGGVAVHWITLQGHIVIPQARHLRTEEKDITTRLKTIHLGWVGYCIVGAAFGLFNYKMLQSTGIRFDDEWTAAVVYGLSGGVCYDLIIHWLRTKWFYSVYKLEDRDTAAKNTAIEALRKENAVLKRKLKSRKK